ncbi:hypothetical protein [Sulfuricurvum sp.]|uniref:hypothetical protein n=1 Tax=Sulfuricurvum sp. TaxID=2025608 RepID=UPI00262783CA|nr:hypothetical protein [Sulfuricurvum sp.]MDD4949638.1 hypothetical protein [Sulfuricurvum sp.]
MSIHDRDYVRDKEFDYKKMEYVNPSLYNKSKGFNDYSLLRDKKDLNDNVRLHNNSSKFIRISFFVLLFFAIIILFSR